MLGTRFYVSFKTDDTSGFFVDTFLWNCYLQCKRDTRDTETL